MLFYVYEYFSWVCICAPCVCLMPVEGALDPPEPKMVVNHHVRAGDGIWSQVTSVLNH